MAGKSGSLVILVLNQGQIVERGTHNAQRNDAYSLLLLWVRGKIGPPWANKKRKNFQMKRLKWVIVSLAVIVLVVSVVTGRFVLSGVAKAADGSQPIDVFTQNLVGLPPRVAKAADGPQPIGYVTCGYSDPSCTGESSLVARDGNGVSCVDDAFPASQTAFPNGDTLIEWASPKCGTNWASLRGQDLGTVFQGSLTITRLSDGKSLGLDPYSTQVLATTHEVETLMVFSPIAQAQACGSINNSPTICAAPF